MAPNRYDGFDVKILKEIVKLRKQDEEERESMLDLYMRAMEQAVPEEKVAKARDGAGRVSQR